MLIIINIYNYNLGFMRGVSTRMVMVAPCTAISWASYE